MKECHLSLDSRGRITLPAEIRGELGNEIIVMINSRRCLELYSEDRFKEKTDGLQKAIKGIVLRRIKRAIFGRSSKVKLDRQGRILIPDYLIIRGNLEREVVLVRVGDSHYKMWDKEKYAKANRQKRSSA